MTKEKLYQDFYSAFKIAFKELGTSGDGLSWLWKNNAKKNIKDISEDIKKAARLPPEI